MPLPSNVSYCTVTGRFLSAVGDGPDAGQEPDGTPVAGLKVTFSTSLNPPVVKNATELVSIVITDIVCATDSGGFLLGPDGTQGVMLVASDDPDLDPHGWTWRVTVEGANFPRIQTSFVAPSGGAVDLATVIPVPPSPGTQIAQWTAAATTATAARDEAVAARDEVLDLLEQGGVNPGESPELRVSGGYLQTKLPSESTWTNVVATSELGGDPTVETLPAGSTLTVFGNVARPTARTDITVQWVHTTLPTAFDPTVDVWLNI